VDLIGWFRIDVCQDLSKHGFERFEVNTLIWERQDGQRNVWQYWYCNRRIDLKLCCSRLGVVRLTVCCCELVKHETDCQCEVLTAVGCCLYVVVFRVGSFAQALNAYRSFVPWRSFNALSIY
jgi:hypothetical protein